MSHFLRRSLLSLLALASLAVLVAAIAGCGKQSSLMTAPDATPDPSLAGLKAGASELRAAFGVQEANTPGLMRVAGVVGTATTFDEHRAEAARRFAAGGPRSRVGAALVGVVWLLAVAWLVRTLWRRRVP